MVGILHYVSLGNAFKYKARSPNYIKLHRRAKAIAQNLGNFKKDKLVSRLSLETKVVRLCVS
jgi:hypothetical protein